MTKLLEEFAKKLDDANLVVVFGLEQQGHIKTIEDMLEKFGHSYRTWEEIGKKINWCPLTAASWYVRYLTKKLEEQK